MDNCPVVANPGQEDANANGIGDVCESLIYDGDLDGDDVLDWEDNCYLVNNPNQNDFDNDGTGDVCEDLVLASLDIDGDSIQEGDNCPFTFNPNQKDSDDDYIGDVCDLDSIYLPPDEDLDGDQVLNKEDNCPAIYNTDQVDSDGDKIGDACSIGAITADIGDIPNPADIHGGGGYVSGCSCAMSDAPTKIDWFSLIFGPAVFGILVYRRQLCK